MKLLIKKWGNSAAIRLPASLLQSTNIKIDTEVEVEENMGKIIIRPTDSYDLDQMLNEIDEENLHHEISFGKPVGKESL